MNCPKGALIRLGNEIIVIGINRKKSLTKDFKNRITTEISKNIDR